MKNNNLIAVHGKINVGKDTVGNIIQILTALPHLTDTGVKSFLGREIDSPYKIKKFADKLKDMVCLLIGCTREQLECREFKEKELGEEWWKYAFYRKGTIKPLRVYATLEEAGEDLKIFKDGRIEVLKPTLRLFLQLLGTEAGRDIIHPNIWCNSLFSDYKNNFTPCKFWKSDRENIKCLCGGVNAGGQNKGITMCESEGNKPKWIITDLRFPNEFKAVKDRNGITIKVERKLQPGKIRGLHYSEVALDGETRWDYVIDNNSSIEDLIKKVREILNKENII